MTQQVRTAYDRHRKRTWGLVLLVAVAVAAVAIPIASGAPDKTYTLLFPSTDAVNPTPPVAGTASAQTLCLGNSYTVKLELKNTSKTASLGSANITFPANRVDLTPDTLSVTGSSTATILRDGNLVKVRDLSLPSKGGTATVTVSLTASTAGNGQPISAIVKQANDFNDTGGDANLFSNPTFPTLAVQTCAGTISGRVWNDQDEDKTKDSFEDAQVGSDVPAGESPWTVTLYQRGAGGTYSAFTSATFTTGATGNYQFAGVPLNKFYVVCVTKPAGDSRTWAQSTPTTPVSTCTGEPNGWGDDATVNASGLAPFTQSQSGRDFGNARSTIVTCGVAVNSDPTFAVQPGSTGDGNCKPGTEGVEYVYEKWTDGGTQFAAFHPALSTGSCDFVAAGAACTYFVQKVTWGFGTTSQTEYRQPDPAGRSLKYDDVPAPGYTFEPMLYCKKDPRAANSEFALVPLGSPSDVKANVLPDGVRGDGDAHTSCLITSTESASGTGGVDRDDFVFTAVDGRMATP